ncbi:CPS_collapsed_G0005920.mRNA.1.CDS.1 [Saccharomyces cerevisiae]|nr:CPS_collapsed_G0005920.mRNA.1.CDS.1 [Saccharomyces cerevisiae]
MHNDSLSKEYQNLSKELFSTKSQDSSSEEVASLTKKLEEANEKIKQLEQAQAQAAVESLPIFRPPLHQSIPRQEDNSGVSIAIRWVIIQQNAPITILTTSSSSRQSN